MSFLWLFMVFGGGYLTLRAIKAYEVAKAPPGELEALAEEIEKLREEHQQLGKQVASLLEGQQFMRELRSKGSVGSGQE